MLRAQRHPARRGLGRARTGFAHASVIGVLSLATFVAGLFPVTIASETPRPVFAAGSFSFPGLAASAPTVTVSSISAAPVPLTVVAPPVTEEAVLAASDETQQVLGSLAAAAANSTQPSEAAVSTREQEQIPLFYRYEVQDGDSVSTIAQKFGVERNYIIWNNVEVIDDENLLQPGQLLQVPTVEGVIHAVRLGETLTEIALQYDADVQDIIGFPANGLSDPNQLRENTMILVPGGRVLPQLAPTLRPQPDQPQLVESRDSSATGFMWPVVGLLTSTFGPSHPLGIDVNAPYVPIAASAPGQVVFAGGDPCCSYGYYVEIDHGGSYSTRYAHMSEFAVTLGEWVEQGQIIGISGNTGHSTGPHVHFELRRGGQIVNPLLFLP